MGKEEVTRQEGGCFGLFIFPHITNLCVFRGNTKSRFSFFLSAVYIVIKHVASG